jgi:hypothetical protein
MPLTSRIPIESETSRISFKDECEDVREKIICRTQDAWGFPADWMTDTLVLHKTQKDFSDQTPLKIVWHCSFPAKPLNLGWPSEPKAWEKFGASLLEHLTQLGHPEVLNTTTERLFNELASQWRRETGMMSMIHKKAMHPAYQRIIGMGKEALPFIFRELNERGGHWLWALCAITGEDAAKPEHNLKQAVKAWLYWGKEHGYL